MDEEIEGRLRQRCQHKSDWHQITSMNSQRLKAWNIHNARFVLILMVCLLFCLRFFFFEKVVVFQREPNPWCDTFSLFITSVFVHVWERKREWDRRRVHRRETMKWIIHYINGSDALNSIWPSYYTWNFGCPIFKFVMWIDKWIWC